MIMHSDWKYVHELPIAQFHACAISHKYIILQLSKSNYDLSYEFKASFFTGIGKLPDTLKHETFSSSWVSFGFTELNSAPTISTSLCLIHYLDLEYHIA